PEAPREEALLAIELGRLATGLGDCRSIKLGQFGASDDRDLGAEGPRQADPHVGADQQAAGIGRCVGRFGLTEQYAGANPEQVGREHLPLQRVPDAAPEGVVGRDRTLQQVSEDAVLLEEVEQFAGHDRAEEVDQAVAQQRPFVVRARVADEPVGVDQAGGDAAEKLHFLAAHDVRAALSDERNAGDDRFALAGPDELCGDLVEPGGAWNIRSFFPAAVRADHPGEQHRMVAEPLANFRDGRLKAAGSNRQHALRIFEFVAMFARRIEQIGAPVGRPPVDRNEAVHPTHRTAHGVNNRGHATSLHRFCFLCGTRMGNETKVECVADVRAELGEGPVWVAAERALYWVDINGRRIFRLSESGERREWPTPMRVGSIAPRARGGFIAGTDRGIALVDLDQDRFEVVASPEQHLPHNRFNDGKVDRQGRFWAGTMDDREKGSAGALYRIDPDRTCTAIDGGYGITNGPAFSPDGARMYHSDTLRQVTYAFDLDAAGEATNRRVFVQFGAGDGHPDGMTVDAEGCLWIALWGGWCVRRFSPDGDLLRTVE